MSGKLHSRHINKINRLFIVFDVFAGGGSYQPIHKNKRGTLILAHSLYLGSGKPSYKNKQ